MNSDKSEKRKIVEALLSKGELTVPQLCKILNANPGNVDYHLKTLIEKGVVRVDKKSYGSKYRVSESKTRTSMFVIWAFAASLALLAVGMLTLGNGLFIQASFFLACSSIIGTVAAAFNVVTQKKNEIQALLDML